MKFDQHVEAVDSQIAKAKELQANKAEKAIRYDFRGIWFPGKVNFASKVFNAEVDFRYATFSNTANFKNSKFFSNAHFGKTVFCNIAFYELAHFYRTAYFNWATFTDQAYFKSAEFFGSETFFRGATFVADAVFTATKFSEYGKTIFDKANFAKDALFDETKFRNEVSFNSAIIGEDADVFFDKSTFSKGVDFRYCRANGYIQFSNLEQYADSTFDFQGAEFVKANFISFHTVRLFPNWFVNVDSRKFVFTDISWKNTQWRAKRTFLGKIKFAFQCLKSGFRQFFLTKDDTLNENIAAELESLQQRGITEQKKRLLKVACRQLAANCEENNRYQDASKFRYMAMELRRLENKGWRRFINLHWFYKWSSSYGESWKHAGLLLLLLILIVFPFFYTRTEFQVSPKNIPLIIAVNGCKEVVNEEVKADCKVEKHSLNLHVWDSGTFVWDGEALVNSLATAALQKVEYIIPLTFWSELWIILEKIFAPLQAALLALAIRRKFMQ